jgi:hypothetical protein
MKPVLPVGEMYVLTLMRYLEDRPHYLMALFALVTRVLGVFHLIAEFEKRVFDVVEPSWWGLAHARCADWRHDGYV